MDENIRKEIKEELAALSWQSECYIRCVFSKYPNCCIEGNVYTVEQGRFTREDGSISSFYRSTEHFNNCNIGIAEMEVISKLEMLELNKTIQPISSITVNTLVIRRDGLPYLAQLTEEGLILVDKNHIRVCSLSDYAADGTKKKTKYQNNNFDIMEIYSIGKRVCDFTTVDRKLLWKRSLTETEVEKLKQIKRL